MKRNLKKNFTKLLLCCTLTTLISSCSKDVEIITPTPEIKASNLSQINAANQEDPKIVVTFYIDDKYLDAGKLNLNPNGPTNFMVSGTFFFLGSESGNLKYRLVHVNAQNIETVISETKNQYFYYKPTANYAHYKLNGKIPAGITDGKVILKGEFEGVDYNMPAKYETTIGGKPYSEPNPFADRYKLERKSGHSVPPPIGSSFAWYPSSTVPMLSPGQSIYSANGQYRMVIQSYDGVLLLLRVSDGKVLWSNKQTGGAYLFFYPDGNLIMLNSSNQMVWSSDIYVPNSNYSTEQRMYLALQNDGNLVMEWNGESFTDVLGATGTGGGIVSDHFGSMKL